jgi:HAL2 family 3'(2'),5'-bisphosphate nucleotidase
MTSEIDVKEYLSITLSAVAQACRVTRLVQRKLEDIRQHTKDDRSPVTVADYAAQAVIAARLASAWGELMLVGEEDAATLRNPGNENLTQAVTDVVTEVWADASSSDVLTAIDLGNHDASAPRYWTLDPIDGTKGFLRGGQYAISLALIEHGEVVLGVLGCPNMATNFERAFDNPDPVGNIFYAARREGAWVVPADNHGATPQPVVVPENADLTTMRVCQSVEAGHSRLDANTRIVQRLGAKGEPARLDSQCKYAVVARGQADAYMRLPTQRSYREKIWDHAAGKIIAEEAGALVTDMLGNALDFSQGTELTVNRGVICAAPAFHGHILTAIDELGLLAEL